ncbi:MAG TPA: arginine--tRNA ligase [Candidatus Paceibacterota bacterium]|nr:arginine--tRNA ligase [Candidatus Paceibacterota bacterium]HRZ34181.1 arginine--tRNA ligase [Candidatus Paceibacterota bacterium]
MKEIIQQLIKENLPDEVDFIVEHPTELKHGDYSTNVALVLAQKNGGNPREIAEGLLKKIQQNSGKDFEKIEIAGPGFINFFLNRDFFKKSVQQVLNGEIHYGRNKELAGKNIIIEFTDPNPFKPLHIGHLMSNSIGESVARILEWNGATVTRVCYQGDVGLHVAKALWGMKQNTADVPKDSATLAEKTEYLGKVYTFGADKYDSDEKAKAEINEINKRVYNLFDEDEKNDDLNIRAAYKKGREWSLMHFNQIYEKLGSTFAELIFEHETAKSGSEIVRENVPAVFELSDGAVVYRGEKDGLHTRVFINSMGLPTYESKDIGLAFYKEDVLQKKFGHFDASVVITAVEQREYYKVVLAALKKLRPEIAEKTLHITHGLMRFAEGKMSSRLGNVITGESLLSEIEDLVLEKIKDRGFDLREADEIKETVAVAALKYSILKQAIGRDIIFDRDAAVSFEGDSGPYLQYTYVRTKSIIDSAKEKKVKFVEAIEPTNWQTTDLERLFYRFPEEVKNAYTGVLSPQNITTLLTKIAGEFNSFYAKNKILDDGPNEAYKVALTKAVMHIIQNGLKILGMKVPNRM